MVYTNRLVTIKDIGALVEEILKINGSDNLSLELPRKQQNAERKKLAGAVNSPKVEIVDKRLKIYWKGGDGQDYKAKLVGIDSLRSYAVVTEVSSARRIDSYRAWRDEK